MEERQRAKIVHGLATIHDAIQSKLSLFRLERYLQKTDRYECCIKQLEIILDDIKYGMKVIEEETHGHRDKCI